MKSSVLKGFIIPTFNDRDTVGLTVMRLARLGLPVILVNDASDYETEKVIKKVCRKNENVICVHRKTNGGKGAAVIDGLRKAYDLGLTHAIQIDADGQHDLDKVGDLLEIVKKHPDKLILGTPVFNKTIPVGRRTGRQISRFFVFLEILSPAINDPLCGFRCYPVSKTLEVINSIKLGLRMNFDPEIAVRLYWKGISILNVPVNVIYPEGGRSSFRMFRDNALFFWLHTRLTAGMILRLPYLIARWFEK